MAAVVALALPLAARAECVERMSRIPMVAAGGPAAGGPMRANMLRARGFAAPAAAPAKAKVRKAHVVRHAKPRPGVRKAAVRRAHRKPAAAPAVFAAPAPVRAPVPYGVAAAEAATPRAYALIAAIICEGGPAPLIAASEGAPAPIGPSAVDTITTIGGPGLGPLFLPETVPPIGGGVFLPPVGPPPPVTQPPLIEQPTFQPPGAIPEPSTWALFILGFGAVGAMLRRRRPTTLVP